MLEDEGMEMGQQDRPADPVWSLLVRFHGSEGAEVPPAVSACCQTH